ncbi:MAG: plasmid mobilization relaxosome protein MobC [Aliarcobacter skirrowii]|uniref:plasmid mobilization protein n=1 Tax=Aliarcobacter skirrowii TaxID=28200 RepID=UPI002431A282|nr:plasmid mobilization relaxosome protein MobC [Aliarcobacter skirrowii]MDD3497871.1 plasmid mobilization relaxosome protein MobC [Aliarcobacter skirrowii]
MTENRTKSIKIRLTDSELEQLQANKGRAELARWLRELGLSGAGGRQEVVKHQLPPELVRTLAGIGSNLNQIARHINTASKSGRGDALLVAVELLTQLAATERALNAVREVLRDR